MAGAAGADSQGRRRRGAVRGKRPRRGREWCVRGAGSAVGSFVDAIQALVRSIWGALAGRFPCGGALSHGVAVGWRVKCTFGAPGGERGNPNARPNPKLKAQPGCAPTGHPSSSPWQRRGKPASRPVEAPQNGRCPATGARSAGPAHALKHSCDAVPETCLYT